MTAAPSSDLPLPSGVSPRDASRLRPRDATLAISEAAAILRAGGLVAFPTETVYGLGADARNDDALRKIFELKGRPTDHPLILHLASFEELPQWVAEVPEAARQLARAFWPGPLTVVLPRHPTVSKVLTGGQDSIAVRVPAHPVARALLQAFGSGIAAPSANRYGHVSPTASAHVRDEFGDAVTVLEGGDCEVGLESTILSLLESTPRILRPGHIQAIEIEHVLAQPVHGHRVAAPALRAQAEASIDTTDSSLPRVPGSTLQHYAPSTPLSLVTREAIAHEIEHANALGQPVAVLARHPRSAEGLPACGATPPFVLAWVTAPTSAAGFAHELYARLRELDKVGAHRILVERVPDEPAWEAVRDRLQRAAAGR